MASHLRPHFFIIGERKCGTSSLYRYLVEHPSVLPGRRKEMQFFTRGADYVREHFADYLAEYPEEKASTPALLNWPELNSEGILYEEQVHFERDPNKRYITGEASADTFCDVPPAMLRHYLPDLRLILIVRDPVERAFSHHRMLRRFQDEGRDIPPVGEFEADMRAELSLAAKGIETPLLTPGVYLGRLQSWVEEWGRDSLLVLFTDDLAEPATQSALLDRVLRHLDLGDYDGVPEVPRTKHNQAPAVPIPPSIREELTAFYAPYATGLAEFLGCAVPWAP